MKIYIYDTVNLYEKTRKSYLKFTINKNGNLIKEVSMNNTKYSADYALELKESISLFIPKDKPTKGVETSERKKTFPKEKQIILKILFLILLLQ